MSIPLRLWLYGAAIAALLAGIAWQVHVQRDVGRAEVQLKWDASVSQQRAAALAESEANARETLRRLERQQESQRAHNLEIARARNDAAGAVRAAGELRDQLAIFVAAARRPATGNPDTAAVSPPAGAAVDLLADMLSRIDEATGVVAAHADAARAAGLKCAADYNSLTR